MSSDFEYLDLGIDFSKVKNIVLMNKPADLRKGIDGYASVIQGMVLCIFLPTGPKTK